MSTQGEAPFPDIDLQIRRAALDGAEQEVQDRKRLALAFEGALPVAGQPTNRLLVVLSSLLLASTTFALLTLRVSVDSSLDSSGGGFVRGELAGVVEDIELFRGNNKRLPTSLEDLDYTPQELEVIHYELLGLHDFRVTYDGHGVRLSAGSEGGQTFKSQGGTGGVP